MSSSLFVSFWCGLYACVLPWCWILWFVVLLRVGLCVSLLVSLLFSLAFVISSLIQKLPQPLQLP